MIDRDGDRSSRRNERRFVGRTSELAALQHAVDKSTTSATPIGIGVIAEAGFGKTALIREFTGTVEDGFVAYGRYEELHAAPYAGIATSLRCIVRRLAENDEISALFATDLANRLGTSANVLTNLVPELTPLLGATIEITQSDPELRRERLMNAVVRLLESVSIHAAEPIILIIDDLHWAGANSFSMIKTMLSAEAPSITVIGTARREEDVQTRLSAAFGSESMVPLGALDTRDIARWVGQVFGAEPDSRVLGLIQAHTEGFPLYIDRLLERAEADGFVTRNTITGAWTWDEQLLQTEGRGPALDAILARTFRDLLEQNPDTMTVVEACACLDARFDLSDAITASGISDRTRVERALRAAQGGHVLVADHLGQGRGGGAGRLEFAHASIAEAARNRLTVPEQQAIQFRFGNSLRNTPERLFDAIRHLSAATDLLADRSERMEFAHLARDGGDRARSQTAFAIARDCYGAGVESVRDHDPDVELLAQLTYGRAEAAWLTNDDRKDKWVREARSAARETGAASGRTKAADAAEARAVHILARMLTADGKAQEALDEARSMLDRLEVNLPDRTNDLSVLFALGRTKRRLDTKYALLERAARGTDDDWAIDPDSDPDTTAAIQWMISDVIVAAYALSDQPLFAHAILRMVDVALERGRIPIAPVAFVSYGVLAAATAQGLPSWLAAFGGLFSVCHRRGLYEEAAKFGDLAVTMAASPIHADYRPWTEFLYYDFIHHWTLPLAEGLEPLMTAHREGLQVGDLEFAGYAAAAQLGQSFFAGVAFPEIDRRGTSLLSGISTEKKQVELTKATQQVVRNLGGEENGGERVNPSDLSGGSTGYAAETGDDYVSKGTYLYSQMVAEYFAGEPDRAIDFVERTVQYEAGNLGTVLVPMTRFIEAMARVETTPRSSTAPRAGREAATKALSRAIREFGLWAQLSEATFKPYHELLLAEQARMQSRDFDADRHYQNASEAADNAGNGLLRALACERQAIALRDSKRDFLSPDAIQKSADLWLGHGNVLRYRKLMTTSGENQEAADAPDEDPDVPRPLRRLIAHAASGDSVTRVLLLVRADNGLAVRFASNGMGVRQVRPHQEKPSWAVAVTSDASVATRTLTINDTRTSVHRDPYLDAHPDVRAVEAIPLRSNDGIVGVLYLEHDRALKISDGEPLTVADTEYLALIVENALLRQERDVARAKESALQVQIQRLQPTGFLNSLPPDERRRIEAKQRIEGAWTAVNADIRGYSRLVRESIQSSDNVAKEFVRLADAAVAENGGAILEVKGDEVLALFVSGAAGALRSAIEMSLGTNRRNRERIAAGKPPFHWGLGIDHGHVSAELVDTEVQDLYQSKGPPVNMASRLQNLTKAYRTQILMSGAALAVIDDHSEFRFRKIDRVVVVGGSEPTDVYEVFDVDSPELADAKLAADPILLDAHQALADRAFHDAAALFGRYLEQIPDDAPARINRDHALACAEHGVPDDWAGARILTSKTET